MILYDPEVNVGIVREADGVVTIQDCHNIRVFADSDKLMYIVPYNENIKSTLLLVVNNNFVDVAQISSYSLWTAAYKDYIAKDYFSENWNYYELLAGLFGLKLKILPEKYFDAVLNLNLQLHKFSRNYSSIPFSVFLDGLETLDVTEITRMKKLNIRDTKYVIDIITSVGFDEMLLLHLFRSLISYHYNPVQNILSEERQINRQIQISNLAELERIKSIVSSFHDTIDIGQNDIKSIVNQFRYLSYLYSWCTDIIPKNNKDDTECIQIGRNNLYHLLEFQSFSDIYRLVTQSLAYSYKDIRFSQKYFFEVVNETEYNIDTYGPGYKSYPDKIDRYFWNLNMYNGAKTERIRIPYLILHEALTYQLSSEPTWREYRLKIYDHYKAVCLYKNINAKYKNSLINVSAISTPLSTYINTPYFSEDDPLGQYEILEKRSYEFVDQDKINV